MQREVATIHRVEHVDPNALSGSSPVGPLLAAAAARRKCRPCRLEPATVATPAQFTPAFSLIEVIIAVGIFAVAIVTILALLPSLSRAAADSADTFVAQSLPEGIRVELTRLAASGGFDALADRLPEMSAPLVDGMNLVAARDGRRLYSMDYLPPPAAGQLAETERYFLVEIWRFSAPPQRFDPASAVLPLYVRVSWPYGNPGATTATPLSARSQLTFVVSLHR